MFAADDIRIEIEEVERDVVLITVDTPVGQGEMIGQISIEADVLMIDKAHVGGSLQPGLLGRAGINAILRKLLVEADVRALVIQGEDRSTGRYKGKRPRPVYFPGRGPHRPR